MSVGSAHGWHERTGRRFVGDADDCDALGEEREAEKVLTSLRRRSGGDDTEIRVGFPSHLG